MNRLKSNKENMDKFKLQDFLYRWNKEKKIDMKSFNNAKYSKTYSKEIWTSPKSFDDIFKIEGVPLWWFYRRYFFPHSLPGLINPFKKITDNRRLNVFDKAKFYFGAKILKKFVLFNGKRKIKHIKKIRILDKNSDKNSNKVLLLSYSNHLSEDGKVFRLEKVIQEIKKDKKLKDFVLFADPLTRKDFKKISRLNNLYKYYDKCISKKAEKKSKELFERWKSINKKTKYNMLRIEKNSLWPYFKYSFDFFFSKELIYLTVLYYKIFKKIIKNENIKAVVVTATNGLFDKCLIAAAKQEKIPLVKIAHGIMYDIKRHSDLIGNFKEAVMNEYAKQQSIKFGAKKENIAVVGPVVYDEITPYIGEKKKKEKNVLIAAAPLIETSMLRKKEYFRRIKKILDDINKIEGVKIALKLHPMERQYKDYTRIIKKMIKRTGNKNINVFKGNITRKGFYKLIQWCDSFIQFFSNSAMEAMIIDRPVINIDIIGYPIKHWLEGIDCIINVDYKEDIKKAVEKSFLNEKVFKIKRKKFVKKYFGKIDGKASKRVVKLIKDLI